MPPDTRNGPPGSRFREGRATAEIVASERASAVLTVTAGSDSGRELAAWAAAVQHLHRLGLPAAVPEFAAAWMRRRGIRADWTTGVKQTFHPKSR